MDMRLGVPVCLECPWPLEKELGGEKVQIIGFGKTEDSTGFPNPDLIIGDLTVSIDIFLCFV